MSALVVLGIVAAVGLLVLGVLYFLFRPSRSAERPPTSAARAILETQPQVAAVGAAPPSEATDSTSRTPASSRTTVLFYTSAFLLTSALAVFVLLENFTDETNLFFAAPTQIILGSTVVLLVFLMFVIGFRRMDLTDKEQALGLPEGSIRALIAVLLIVIFFIFANVIFGNFASPNDVAFGPLDEAQVSDLLQVNPGAVITSVTTTGDTTEFRGIIAGEVDASVEKLGLQMFTGLMTLISAVTAFYFGTNSVKAATASAIKVAESTGGTSAAALAILQPSGSPGLLERVDGGWRPITVELTAPANVAAIEGDVAGSVAFVQSEDVFRYTPTQPEPVVKVTFSRRDRGGQVAVLELRRPVEGVADTTETKGTAETDSTADTTGTKGTAETDSTVDTTGTKGTAETDR